ncbi:MAG: STAS domain-containing protein [Spirochaetia bacterium]|nr:STAS domain-containing protein [Spirochaetia bacterium]
MDGLAILRLVGDLNMQEVEDLKVRILEILQDVSITQVLLDCRKIERMDSSGIGLFIQLDVGHKKRIAFRLFGLRDSIKQLFKLTRLSNFIQIDETEEEGLAAFRKTSV